MAAASLKVGDEFMVPSSIKDSITAFIDAIGSDEGVRQSISNSLKIKKESLLDEYLNQLNDSFILSE